MESVSAKKARLQKILRILENTYPDAKCALHFDTPFQLLVAVILSAQCTDVQVNKVTPRLFRLLPDAAAFAQAPIGVIEELIHSTGFYRNKAKNIQGAAMKIVMEYAGKIPETMNKLVKLPGVGRKTANVILDTAFQKNSGVVVDTHVLRISSLLGLISAGAKGKPEKVERELMKLLPKKYWGAFSHTLIWHGRKICIARRPKCTECSLFALCPGRRI